MMELAISLVTVCITIILSKIRNVNLFNVKLINKFSTSTKGALLMIYAGDM